MKKTLILDKELVTADLDNFALDGGTVVGSICVTNWSCYPDLGTCPSCSSCGGCPEDEE